MRATRILIGMGAVAALGSGFDTPLAAQLPRRPVLSLSAGPTRYDLSGTGTGVTGAVRLDLTGLPFLVLELGVGYFHYTTQAGNGLTYLLPEVSAQLQLGVGPMRPYVGGGIGVAEPSSGTITSNLQTVHVVAGARFGLGPHWVLRAEGRLRSVNPFHGSMLDITAGLGRRL
jgi:hypothetical protein